MIHNLDIIIIGVIEYICEHIIHVGILTHKTIKIKQLTNIMIRKECLQIMISIMPILNIIL